MQHIYKNERTPVYSEPINSWSALFAEYLWHKLRYQLTDPVFLQERPIGHEKVGNVKFPIISQEKVIPFTQLSFDDIIKGRIEIHNQLINFGWEPWSTYDPHNRSLPPYRKRNDILFDLKDSNMGIDKEGRARIFDYEVETHPLLVYEEEEPPFNKFMFWKKKQQSRKREEFEVAFYSIDVVAEYICYRIDSDEDCLHKRSEEQIKKDLYLITNGDASKISIVLIRCYLSQNFDGLIEEFISDYIKVIDHINVRNEINKLQPFC